MRAAQGQKRRAAAAGSAGPLQLRERAGLRLRHRPLHPGPLAAPHRQDRILQSHTWTSTPSYGSPLPYSPYVGTRRRCGPACPRTCWQQAGDGHDHQGFSLENRAACQGQSPTLHHVCDFSAARTRCSQPPLGTGPCPHRPRSWALPCQQSPACMWHAFQPCSFSSLQLFSNLLLTTPVTELWRQVPMQPEEYETAP